MRDGKGNPIPTDGSYPLSTINNRIFNKQRPSLVVTTSTDKKAEPGANLNTIISKAERKKIPKNPKLKAEYLEQQETIRKL